MHRSRRNGGVFDRDRDLVKRTGACGAHTSLTSAADSAVSFPAAVSDNDGHRIEETDCPAS